MVLCRYGWVLQRRLLGKSAPSSPIALVLVPLVPDIFRRLACGRGRCAGLLSMATGDLGRLCEVLLFVERCGVLYERRYWAKGRGCCGWCRRQQGCRLKRRRVSMRGNSRVTDPVGFQDLLPLSCGC